MKKIALVGLPNCGKSSLFNVICGAKQKIANFPGITVEKKSAHIKLEGNDIEVIDLPGLYTLDARTADERISRDFILNKKDKIDLFILVIDSTNIKRSLYLAKQLKELNLNFTIALNMIDLSEKRGQKLDIDKISSLYDTKVIATSARNNLGIEDLKDSIIEKLKDSISPAIPSGYIQKIKDPSYIKETMAQVKTDAQQMIETLIRPDTFTQKLDKVLLHPVLGLGALFLILLFTFQLLFTFADPFIGYIEMGFEFIASIVDGVLPDGYFKALMIDGVIAGVGGFVVFLPHVIFLFILIYLLEDFGYLGRMAFLLDFFMRKLGLPGKAVVPLLSSHACAIPGIMGARIIENQNQRLITMLVSPLMTCSARLPVYTLLIGAIFTPSDKVLGLDARGLLMFALYAFGIIMGFVISFISKNVMGAASVNTLMMELPSYKVPQIKNVLVNSWQKGMIFLKKAGTIIFALSILIWVLVTFPSSDLEGSEQINNSYAAKIGRTFEPVFKPIGFDWKITTALIPSFGAREVLVSAMGTVMAVDEEDEDKLVTKLSDSMKSQYSIATLLSLLVWFIFSPQCIATFGVLKRETAGYKIPIIFGAYTLGLAYFFSWITYIAFS
ncbi:MAG: ferrous iron transporter B [Bacteriovoracaceae bacterium]|nr:ferrous iron transporter B [Bacteriovoracaceae bacterium]